MSDANTTLRPESPLNQKGPVSEDLRAALDAWLQNHPGRSLLAAEYLADGYLAGHSDGWNRCLDEVRTAIKTMVVSKFGLSQPNHTYMLDHEEIISELEKKRI